MSMKEWAKSEVKIACAREVKAAKVDGHPEDAGYGVACYRSAMKAFNSLMKDGHSGYSIGFTKNILMALIDGKPLTPIEDTDDIWNDVSCDKNGVTNYQCKRMSSLFKDVYPDGTVKYNDVNSVIKVDTSNGSTWSSGLILQGIY